MKKKPAVRLLITFAAIFVTVALELHATIPASERQALLDLYNSTNGDEWTNNDGWLGPVGTECSWYGVTCDYSEGSVVEVDLSKNQLLGPLPASIGDLTYLARLDLHSYNGEWGCWEFRLCNFLNGPLPSEIGSLQYLLYLDLTNTTLPGALPPEIGGLVNLRQLKIAENNLEGTIPPAIGSLRKLEILDLSYNSLDGPIPPEIGDMVSLQSLRLWGYPNHFSGPIPAEIWNLVSLRELVISGWDLTGSIPPEIGNLVFLQRLILLAPLTGSIPPEIGNLVSLQELSLRSGLTGQIPAEIGNLVSLQELILAGSMTGPIPSEIGNLGSLRKLNLRGQLSGPIPSEIGNLSLLYDLNLAHNELSGPIPSEIGYLTLLHDLSLEHNRLSGALPATIGGLASLKWVQLDSNKITGELPSTLLNSTAYRFCLPYNAVFTHDPDLVALLEGACSPLGISIDTQTLAPENVAVTAVGDHTVWLSWDPVDYQQAGGYEVYASPTGDDNWSMVGIAENKGATAFPATGLDPGMTYDLAVSSFTRPHEDNDNRVVSTRSTPVMAGTSDLGCDQPVIVIGGGGGSGVTLSLEGQYDSYLWSTGETTPTIEVPTTPQRWYWVTVTSSGSCEETAVMLVGPDAASLFSDGFESGDMAGWSTNLP